jgi:hypothetical protein
MNLKTVNIKKVENLDLKFEEIETKDKKYVEYMVTLVNNSNKEIFVTRVSTGCGCTDATFSKLPVLKEESTNVKFSFNPAGRQGFNQKSVNIFYSDTDDEAIIKVSFTVNVK